MMKNELIAIGPKQFLAHDNPPFGLLAFVLPLKVYLKAYAKICMREN